MYAPLERQIECVGNQGLEFHRPFVICDANDWNLEQFELHLQRLMSK